MLVPLLDVSRLSDPAPYRRRPPAPTPRVTRAGRRSPPVQRQMDESFQRSPLSAPDATRGEVLEHRHTPRRICWFRCSKFPEFPILIDAPSSASSDSSGHAGWEAQPPCPTPDG